MPLPSDMTLLKSEPDLGTFILKETSDQVSLIHRRRKTGLSKNKKTRWTKFLPVETLTIKISTVQGKKALNVFRFKPKKSSSTKLTMSNITNSRTEFGKVVFFIKGFETEFFTAVNRALKRHELPEIEDIYDLMKVAYPFFKHHFEAKMLSIVPPFLTQIGRLKDFDAFCEKFKITDPELIQWLRENSPMTSHVLFWVSALAQVHNDETILAVLKNLPSDRKSEEYCHQENIINSLQNTPNQYRGIFSKVPSETLISIVKTGNFSYEGLCWGASAWSKNYRTLRKNKDVLASLGKEEISEYILSYLYPKIYFKKQALLPVKYISISRGQKIMSKDIPLENGILSYRGCSIYQLVGLNYRPDNAKALVKTSHLRSEEAPYFIKVDTLKSMFPGLMSKIEPLLFGESDRTQFLPSITHVRYFFYIAERYFKERFKVTDDNTLNVLFSVLETNISAHATSSLDSRLGNSVIRKIFPEPPHNIFLRNTQLKTLVSLVENNFPLVMAIEIALKANDYKDLLDLVCDGQVDMPLEVIHTYFELEIPLDSPAPF